MRGARVFGVLGCIALAGLSSVAMADDALGGVNAVRAAASGAVLELASPALRLAGMLVSIAGALALVWRMLRREAALGRGAAPSAGEPGAIDAAWLREHVFSMSPELVGALHDRRIAWPELAAVLARMSVESKLASRVASGARGWNNLELWLLVEREELSGYERELVDSLFFDEKSTSAEAVQEAYRAVGFDPAHILRRELQSQCDARLGLRPLRTRPLGWALGVSVLGLLLTLRPWAAGVVPAALAALAVLVALGPLWGASLLARRWSQDLELPASKAWPFLALVATSIAALALLIGLWPALPALGALGFAASGLLGAALVAQSAASRESAEGFALRQRLLAARRFFAQELASPEPRIDDDWLPYLIALDLTREVDHWYLAFGRIETAAHQRQAQRAEADAAAPSSAGQWTGGAGAFGRSGASGAWIAATSGLIVATGAAGTRSPESSGPASGSAWGGARVTA